MPTSVEPEPFDAMLIVGWVDHPSLDYLAVTAAVALALAVGKVTDFHPLHSLPPEGRYVWLQTLAGLAGGFVGVSLTVLAVILALSRGPLLERVFAHVGTRLTRILVSGIAGLGFAATAFALILPLAGSRLLAIITVWLTAFAVIRLGRVVWVLAQLAHIFAAEIQAPR